MFLKISGGGPIARFPLWLRDCCQWLDALHAQVITHLFGFRAKYVLNIVGHLHKFYASQPSTHHVTSLDVFNDITQLTSSIGSSPQTKIKINSPASSSDRLRVKRNYSEQESGMLSASNLSSADNGQSSSAKGHPATMPIQSSDAAAAPPPNPRPQQESTVVDTNLSQRKHSHPDISACQAQMSLQGGTPGNFRRNLRTVRKSSTSSSSSAASSRRRTRAPAIVTSTPVLSDARSTWSLPPDTYMSPQTRTQPKTVITSKCDRIRFIRLSKCVVQPYLWMD